MNKTGCTCNGPGWCQRHKIQKSQHLFNLCQTRQDYFDLWERQQQNPVSKEENKTKGWGDKLHYWLADHGITEERYKKIKEKFGLPPTCNCPARREWLNRVGEWLTNQE